MDPHDPGISKNKPFKKGQQNFYLAVVLCRATYFTFTFNELTTIIVLCFHLQSQSELLGHFAVFLPSQCWCARFGELPVINNIGRTRR